MALRIRIINSLSIKVILNAIFNGQLQEMVRIDHSTTNALNGIIVVVL